MGQHILLWSRVCFSFGKISYINLISVIRDGVCPLFGSHNTAFYPDKFADREIRQLFVICENKENGCNWRDELRNYEVLTYSPKNKLECILSLWSHAFSKLIRASKNNITL